MKNGYLLITYYLLLITPESPCVDGGEDVKHERSLDFKDCRYNISDRTCIEPINIVISKSA
ncbi:MAG: hypothetical protein V7K63_21550 [Nostoc sp.]